MKKASRTKAPSKKAAASQRNATRAATPPKKAAASGARRSVDTGRPGRSPSVPASKKSALQGLAAVASARAKASRAREARGLIESIARRITAAEEAFYEIGAALVRLRDPAMFGALGFGSFEEALGSIPKLSREVAYRCLRIATHYDERTALALSQSKAIALLTYVEASPAPDDAQSLAEADAQIDGVPISEQTVEGLVRAAAAVRPGEHRRAREGEVEVQRDAGALEKRLRTALRLPVEVRAVRRKGAWRLLVDLPAEAAPRLSIGKR
jgi:hypothetical protein